MKKIISTPYFVTIVLLMGLMLSSCNISRHLEKDQYLLKNDPDVKHGNLIPSEKFSEGIQLEGNRKVVVSRLGLRVHNYGKSLEKGLYRKKSLANDTSAKAKFVKWIQYKLGEPPKILDTTVINKDIRILKNICFAHGYFHPQVSYKIDTLRGVRKKKQQVNVTYFIKEGTSYRIKDVKFVIDQPNRDTALIRSQYFRTPSLIKRGKLYSHRLFEQERARATNQSKIGSFYSFEPSLVNFVVDTNLAVNSMIDTLNQPGPKTKWVKVEIHITESRPSYIIREIEFQLLAPQGGDNSDLVRFNTSQLSAKEREALGLTHRILDSTTNINFVVARQLLKKINYNFLAKRIEMQVGRIYSLKFDTRTRSMLRELSMFQYMLIRYQTYPNMRNQLKMVIEGRLLPQYEAKLGLEVFSNDITETTNLIPNAGLKLSLRNKNTLKKSQLLDLSTIGNIGYNTGQGSDPRDGFVSYQFGAEASMKFYSFLFSKPIIFFLPDKLVSNLSRYSPTTILSSSINFKRFNGINQIVPGARISYQWQHFPSIRNRAVSKLSPLSISYFDPQNDSTTLIFRALEGTQIKNWDFNERITSRLTYSYTQQTYRESLSRPTYYFQIGTEYGGLLPFLLERYNLVSGMDRGPDSVNSILEWFPQKNIPESDRRVDSVHYGFFGKLQLEGKYLIPLGSKLQAVVRGKIGISSPFFQTRLTPKEARFFSGGVNSLRGWQANTLGPGQTDLTDFGFNLDSIGNFGPLLSPGGDFQFEANAELRFRLISWIEVAGFTDVGNVWLTRRSASTLLSEEVADKAVLSTDNLYLGWDAGLGIRFDFAYLILRLDLGLQLFSPSLIDPDNAQTGWNIQLRQGPVFPNGFRPLPSIGLNYPF
ncbi:MAG: BamA/TamA family outer membrane protein [Bacteroidia bacterium]|nr:BamA/TamA family outer membrane protein [Bacteroidia bacterium]